MHYHTLAVIHVPEVQDNPEMDEFIAQNIAQLEAQVDDSFGAIIKKIRIKELKNMLSEFVRCVDAQVEDRMAPYDENTENPEFLEFEDWTDDLMTDFEKSVNCIRTPDGRLVEAWDYPFHKMFTVKDGEIYSVKAGPLKHTKKTRKSRKYKALPNYPRKKIYKDFKDYAERGRGFDYDEENQGYGYMSNPNGTWDWYVIGGRWPATFLVKADCADYAIGQHDYQDSENAIKTPEGYRWVSAARKKDIQWDKMREWTTEQVTKQYYAMKDIFETGGELPDGWYHRSKDGFYSFDGCAYLHGDTLETHLAKHDIPTEWKYPVSFCDIVSDAGWEGEYKEFKKTNSLDGVEEYLRRVTDETIDSCADDDVLVSVDYHS